MRVEKTEAERKAWGEKMKAAKEAKRIEREGTVHPTPGVSPRIDGEDIQGLLKRVEELAAELKAVKADKPQKAPEQAQSTLTPGGLVGITDRYIIDPDYYPDPTLELANLARLAPFAFNSNYELVWEVTRSVYEHNGINTQEPKFTIKLIRKMLDEGTGEDTGMRYMQCQAIFHEDPQAALVVARDNGVDVDSMGEREFLDRMRFLRMRDWLIQVFYPPKSQAPAERRQQVVGNRLVEIYEVNGPVGETQKIPYSEISKKLVA